MAYIVHGATGAQGGPLIQSLGAQAVAAVRDPEAYSGAAVAADFGSVESLVSAYRGADGVFVHLPLGSPDFQAQCARNVVEAVAEAQPARVVYSTSGQVVDAPGTPLQTPAEGATAILVGGLVTSGVSAAVIAPRLYLENLLQPELVDAVRAEGVLRYPLRPDFPASWCSHLDIADAAFRLLQDHSVTGVVGVGQLPAITGPDLAAAFAAHFGRDVRFEAVTPEDFSAALVPLFGEDAAAQVERFYTVLSMVEHDQIEAETSAQKLLGLTPRSVEQWLADVRA